MRMNMMAAALLAASVTIPRTAAAVTAGDVMDRMNADQRGSYIAGGVEMAAFLSAVRGNKSRATCIMNWYYKQGGIKRVVGALENFRDRQALPVLHIVIRKACGE